MSVNVELKEILKLFQRTSFRIAFLFGVILLKILVVNYSNDILKIAVDILLAIAAVFLMEDIISRFGFSISKKIKHQQVRKNLQSLNKSQVLVLIDHFFNFSNSKIELNQIGYFAFTDGLYNTLTSASIIMQANAGTITECPFMMLSWAYDDLSDAIRNKDVDIKRKNKIIEVKWYEKNYKYDEDELNTGRYI